MSASHEAGPLIVWGAQSAGSSAGKNPEAGPSVLYQGVALADVQNSYNIGQSGVGNIRAFYDTPWIPVVDHAPEAFGAAGIAAAQVVTASTAMTLATAASTGFSLKAIVATLGGTVHTGLVGLDIGFTTATTTANSATVAVGSSAAMTAGMPIAIMGAGVAGAPHFTKVLTIASATSITIVDAAITAVTSQRLATSSDAGTYLDPYVPAGAARLFDPQQGCARAVSITASATSAATGTFTVAGYDVFGRAMTETISFTGGAATAKYGAKAFKYIASVTPHFTTTGFTYSVGNSDVFGYNIRSDIWEKTRTSWAGIQLSATTAYTAADATSPATATTGDVRGTIQISQYGTSTTYPAGGAANGTLSLVSVVGIPMRNAVTWTPDNLSPVLGVTQA